MSKIRNIDPHCKMHVSIPNVVCSGVGKEKEEVRHTLSQ